jgi:signal transduction histidine kinase
MAMEKNEKRNNKHQLLGQLFSDLMHEIRNPLSVLKINLDLLKTSVNNKSIDSNEEINEIIQTGGEAIQIIENLIGQTLEFVREQEGQFEHCSINNIAKTVYAFTKTHAKKKGVALILDLAENDSQIVANKGQIVQVLLNLISNSFDAVNEDPKIIIKTKTNENSSVFEISDNGVGIEQKKMEKIFNKYYTTKQKGAGIGLAVSKEILDNHGAEISVESKVGEGTTFYIKFNNAKGKNK